MEKKIANIQMPVEEEEDNIPTDSTQSLDVLFPEIMEGVARQRLVDTEVSV